MWRKQNKGVGRWTAIVFQVGAIAIALSQGECGNKPVKSNLPEVPPDLAGELKAIAGTNYFVVQPSKTPTIKEEVPTQANPGAVKTGGGTIAKKACAGTTTYTMDAIYPVLICHPLLDDLRPPSAGAKPTVTARTATTTWAPEGQNKYQIANSAKGLLVCADARMPVRGQLDKITSCEDGSDQFIRYRLNLNGLVTLNWVGDTNARPAGLILFEPWLYVSSTLTACSGTSTGNSACPSSPGTGGGFTPAVAKSPK